MDIGLGAFGLSARPDHADDFSFAHGSPRADRNRSQVNERDGVPVFCANRQAAALARHLAGERNDSGHGRVYVGARRCADIDSTVLTASVRVVAGDEGSEHRPLDRPAPPGRTRHESERRDQSDRDTVA